MKKFIVFANTMKRKILFGKHYEKINSVFGERPNLFLALCSEFLLRVLKILIEDPVYHTLRYPLTPRALYVRTQT